MASHGVNEALWMTNVLNVALWMISYEAALEATTEEDSDGEDFCDDRLPPSQETSDA